MALVGVDGEECVVVGDGKESTANSHTAVTRQNYPLVRVSLIMR